MNYIQVRKKRRSPIISFFRWVLGISALLLVISLWGMWGFITNPDGLPGWIPGLGLGTQTVYINGTPAYPYPPPGETQFSPTQKTYNPTQTPLPPTQTLSSSPTQGEEKQKNVKEEKPQEPTATWPPPPTPTPHPEVWLTSVEEAYKFARDNGNLIAYPQTCFLAQLADPPWIQMSVEGGGKTVWVNSSGYEVISCDLRLVRTKEYPGNFVELGNNYKFTGLSEPEKVIVDPNPPTPVPTPTGGVIQPELFVSDIAMGHWASWYADLVVNATFSCKDGVPVWPNLVLASAGIDHFVNFKGYEVFYIGPCPDIRITTREGAIKLGITDYFVLFSWNGLAESPEDPVLIGFSNFSSP